LTDVSVFSPKGGSQPRSVFRSFPYLCGPRGLHFFSPRLSSPVAVRPHPHVTSMRSDFSFSPVWLSNRLLCSSLLLGDLPRKSSAKGPVCRAFHPDNSARALSFFPLPRQKVGAARPTFGVPLGFLYFGHRELRHRGSRPHDRQFLLLSPSGILPPDQPPGFC